MIDRRAFVHGATGSLLLAAVASRAQPAPRVYRLGWLRSITSSASDPVLTLLPRALAQLGWIEGQNLKLDVRHAEGQMERLPALARELVALRCDAIVAGGTGATRAAREATTAIPIVMVGNFDPVALGFVASLARPGGNVTGVLAAAEGSLAGKKLELLRQVVPGARRIAFLASDDPNIRSQGMETQRAANALGIDLLVVAARGNDYASAFATMVAERCSALLVAAAPFSLRDRKPIIELAAKHKLPTIWEWPEQAQDGGLMSYGANLAVFWQRIALYVDRVLRGVLPADLPVEQPTRVELVINLRVAKALGVTIPQSLLLRADEVIQ